MKDAHLPLLLVHYKAYHSFEDTSKDIKRLLEDEKNCGLHICIAVPFTFIKPLCEKFKQEEVSFGAELMLNVNDGNFPATIAAKMLKEAGAQFVLIGSGEEHKIYGPHGFDLQEKMLKAVEVDLMPIICVNETEQEAVDGLSKSVLATQLSESLHALTPEQFQGLHILYDASWINLSPWEATSERLHTAYSTFQSAVAETFPTEIVNGLKLMYTVPTFSLELPTIIQSLPAAGYSLGLLNATSELRPTFFSISSPKIEETQPVSSTVPISEKTELSEATNDEVLHESQPLPETIISDPNFVDPEESKNR